MGDGILEVELLDTVVGGGGTKDYNDLENKPQINGVELIGNKSGEDLGLASSGDIQGLEERVSAVEGDVSDVKADIEVISGEIDDIQDDVNNINDEIDTINGNIQTLSDGLQEAQQDIQEHTNDIDQLTNGVADLENDVADALDNISTIDTAINKNVVSGIGVTAQTDNVSITSNIVNIKTGATSSDTDAIPLANDSTAGLMSHSDYQQIRQNTEDIAALKGQTIRIAYSIKTNPTPQEINDFVVAQGYTQDQFPQIAVVVTGTNYVWRYYENDGWTQQTDVVSIFTNTTAGIIKGTTADGKIYAETDGTGSVNGWDTLKNRVTNVENNKADKSELSDYVPTTRTVNGKALSQNINLDADDVGALPDTTTYVSTVNGQSGAITNIESTTNKVTTISASSTDTQYPSAKAVYDNLGLEITWLD